MMFEKTTPKKGRLVLGVAHTIVRRWTTGAAAGFAVAALAVAALAVAASTAAMSAGVTAASAQSARVEAVSAKAGDVGKSADVSGTASVPATVAPRSKLAGRYFVDFRARTAASYGHAFIWYGRLNDRGKVGKIEVAGLHPATDSVIPYILGHLIPVPAETGKSYGDLDEQYLTASYRVYLSEADAKRVFAYIQDLQAHSLVWQAGLFNCTAFLADVAHFMGLRTPTGATWMYPENLVNGLRDVNGGRTEVVLAAQGNSTWR